MPSHEIRLTIPSAEVVNADAVFRVWSDEELLGELRISRGSVDWRPGRHQYTHRLDWEQFDALMREHARRDG